MTTAVDAPRSRVGSPSARRGTTAIGYALLALLAYVPVLRSDPGRVAADTKQYLYLDPARVLERAWSMWDPNIGLGTVTHQNIGYLFPMGPFYWALDRLGVADWVAQRLWLGTIIFAAGAGMLFLFRALGRRGPGVVVGTLAFMLAPYTLDYSARISVILLSWAGLPWLLAFVIRGLRDDPPSNPGSGGERLGKGGWRYPALFALVVQLVGGVNATALVFVAIGPVLWVPYSVWVVRESTLRRAWDLVWKTVLLTGLASLWWISGLWAQGSYGLDILRFTETVKAVSRASLAPEVLRGLGYWFFYGQDKVGPWTESSVPYMQSIWLILVSYTIPVLALLSAALVRWRHRAYFALLALVGVTIAVGTYPYEHPSPAGALFQEFAKGSAGLALRSTGRAIPLMALGFAALLAAGVDALNATLAGRGRRVGGLAAAVAVGALVVVNMPSLWQGTYYGANLERAQGIPQYWKDAIAALDARPHDTRILELPGADFASYRWGNTVDPITPGLTDRPYVARELIPWGSPATANLLNALDRRIQEGLLDPNALAPVARLMSVGDVTVRNDLQTDRYNLIRPRSLWKLFEPTPAGLGAPTTFGTAIPGAPTYPQIDEQALAYPPDRAPPPPLAVFPVEGAPQVVRATSSDQPLIVSGDGEGIVDAATAGLLPGNNGTVLYSASYARRPRALRAAIARDATLVVSDSNRKQGRRWSTVRDNLGYTERADERPLTDDPSDARLNLFPGAGPDAYTTVEQRGVRGVEATAYGNPVSFTPEDRGERAFDGDTFTAWKVGAFGPVEGQRLRVRLDRPVTTDRVNFVQPLTGPRDRWVTSVALRFDGGRAVHAPLGDASRVPAGETVRFPKRTFTTLEVEIAGTNTGPLDDYSGRSAVGFAEVRIPDDRSGGKNATVTVDEVVKMPTDLVRAAGTASLAHPLVYTMTRDRTVPVPPRYDPELELRREFRVPAGRAFALAGDARINSVIPDDTVDNLLGIPGVDAGGVTATSSQRLPGDVRARASSAIDGDLSTAWQTQFGNPRGQWMQLRTPHPVSVGHLDLTVFADGRHSVPTRLELRSADGSVRQIAVPPIADQAAENATATVPLDFEPITASTITLTLADVRPVRLLEYFSREPIDAPVAIAEVGIPGVRRAAPPVALSGACRRDLLTVDGRPVPVRLTGTTATVEQLGALGVALCEPALRLDAGAHVLRGTAGGVSGFDLDRLVLSSGAGGTATAVTAPAPPARAAPAVRVTTHSRDSATIEVEHADRPFWLVLGQSVNAGWRATANGKDLGASTLVDGFANGWRVPGAGSGRMTITVRWTPQRVVDAALAVSAVAFAAACVVVLWTWVRRRRGPSPSREPLSDTAPVLVWPARLDPDRSRPAVLVGVPLVAGVVAGLLLQPWAAPVVAGAALAALCWPRARLVLRLFPSVAVALCGLYIAVQQLRHGFAPKFEWPTFFGRVNQLAWLAILALATDALIEITRSRDRGPARRG